MADQRFYLSNNLYKARDNVNNDEESYVALYRYILVLYLTLKWHLYFEWDQNISTKKGKEKTTQEKIAELFADDSDLQKYPQLQFALQVLRDAKLTLPLSIICRYFIKWQCNKTDENLKDMEAAAKALVAFSALWLSGSESTDSIDMVFRKFLNGNSAHSVLHCPDNQLNADALRKHLQQHYCSRKNQKCDLQTWTVALKGAAVAKDRPTLARFLQMIYVEFSNVNSLSPIGARQAIRRLKNKQNSMLNTDDWHALSALELEHILPQTTKGTAWEKFLADCKNDVDRGRRINQLGNITFLPKVVNIKVGNHKWATKKAFYVALADDVGDVLAKLVANKKAFQIGNKELAKIKKNKPLLQEFAQSEWPKGFEALNAWSRDTIDKRTEAIAAIVWPRLCDWLGMKATQSAAVQQPAQPSQGTSSAGSTGKDGSQPSSAAGVCKASAQTQATNEDAGKDSSPKSEEPAAAASADADKPKRRGRRKVGQESQVKEGGTASGAIAKTSGTDELAATVEKAVNGVLGQGEKIADDIVWRVKKAQAQLRVHEQRIDFLLSPVEGFRIRNAPTGKQDNEDGKYKFSYASAEGFDDAKQALLEILSRWKKKASA